MTAPTSTTITLPDGTSIPATLAWDRPTEDGDGAIWTMTVDIAGHDTLNRSLTHSPPVTPPAPPGSFVAEYAAYRDGIGHCPGCSNAGSHDVRCPMDRGSIGEALLADPSMFSDDGNDAMRRIFAAMTRELYRVDGMVPTADGIYAKAKAALATVARQHPEAHDTEGEWWAVDVIGALMDDLGLARPADLWSIRDRL